MDELLEHGPGIKGGQESEERRKEVEELPDWNLVGRLGPGRKIEGFETQL